MLDQKESTNKNIWFLGTWENSPTPLTRVWIIQRIWYVWRLLSEWIEMTIMLQQPILIFFVISWDVVITFAVISFLLLRASFQTGANDNSSELMGKNENNFAEPCDRDYYGNTRYSDMENPLSIILKMLWINEESSSKYSKVLLDF